MIITSDHGKRAEERIWRIPSGSFDVDSKVNLMKKTINKD